MSSKEINSTRRILLVAAGAVPALAAVLMARKEKAVEIPVMETSEQPSSAGYHETDHIRKYYYTAGYF